MALSRIVVHSSNIRLHINNKDHNRVKEMFHTSVNSETTMTFSISVIAVASLFVPGIIVGSQNALAANLCGSGLGCGGSPDYGISYPSPLSNFFDGCSGCYDNYPYYSGVGFHHFHGGVGFHHH